MKDSETRFQVYLSRSFQFTCLFSIDASHSGRVLRPSAQHEKIVESTQGGIARPEPRSPPLLAHGAAEAGHRV